MSLYRPAGPHRPHLAPAMCLCVECSRVVLAKRCEARFDGNQCGNYALHRGQHTVLVATVFTIAAEHLKATP